MIRIIYPVDEPRKRDEKRRRFGLEIGKKTYRVTKSELFDLINSIAVAVLKEEKRKKVKR